MAGLDNENGAVAVATPGPKVAPVALPDRIDSLDVLRGFAVLGIFIMNIQLFAMYGSVYVNPSYHGMLEGAGYYVWYLSHLLVDLKFMNIFSLLFGAGIVLFTFRKEEMGQKARPYHYRRMGWLILFGILHAYLLWDGDVLYLYGVCGLWVYLFRKVRPSRLIVIGLVVLAVGSGLALAAGFTAPYWGDEVREGFVRHSWRPSEESLARMTAAYGHGSYWEQVKYRAPSAFSWQTSFVLYYGLWRAGGMMLLGMALFKLGVLNAARSRKFYTTMIVVGAAVGVPVIVYGVSQTTAREWEPFYSMFFGRQYNYWASLLVSGGYIGAVMLMCKSDALHRFTRPFAATGRMAFSNYIAQSLIASFVFFGTGLGYYNQIDRVGQIAVVASVWALQLVVSTIWLKHFRFGPLEWLWRSLTYGSRQPFRVRSGSS